jgi:hypothetical protein
VRLFSRLIGSAGHSTFFHAILAVVSTLFFDEERDRSGMERNKMLITFNYQITLMEMKTENRDKIMSHEKPVTAAIYNSVYNQVGGAVTCTV